MVFQTSAFAGAMRSLNEYREFVSWIPDFTKGKLWPTVIREKQSEDKSTVNLLADGTLIVRSRRPSWHISKWDAHFVQAAVSQREDTTASDAPETIRELWRWYCSQLNEHESVPYKDRLVDLLMLLVSSMDLAQVYGLSEPSHFEDGNADPYVPVGYYITSWHRADGGECEDLPGSDFAMRLVSAAIAGRCFMVSNILPHSDEPLLHSIYFLGCGHKIYKPEMLSAPPTRMRRHYFYVQEVTDTRYSAMATLYTLALKLQTRR
jgi:hypothetical protein